MTTPPGPARRLREIAGRNWFQRSGRVTTKGKRSWTFGRIEARIALPNATATWPAFWMMGDACDDTATTNFNAPITQFDTMASNWASCGEVDIMKHRNSETVTFHLYTIEWEPTQIRWYIDRTTNPNPVHTVDLSAANQEEFRKPFHIILNLAIGASSPARSPSRRISRCS